MTTGDMRGKIEVRGATPGGGRPSSACGPRRAWSSRGGCAAVRPRRCGEGAAARAQRCPSSTAAARRCVECGESESASRSDALSGGMCVAGPARQLLHHRPPPAWRARQRETVAADSTAHWPRYRSCWHGPAATWGWLALSARRALGRVQSSAGTRSLVRHPALLENRGARLVPAGPEARGARGRS